VKGDLDAYQAPRFRQAVIDLLRRGARSAVLDLIGVDTLDSFGGGAIAFLQRRVVAGGGTLTVLARDSRIIRYLELTGLTKDTALVVATESGSDEWLANRESPLATT
jgi:anti-sigma B factor antagonist